MTSRKTRWPHFVHLRVRTSSSILHSTISPEALAEWAQRTGSPAVAVTDSDNLHAVLEVSETLAKAGIQPIAGMSLSIADDHARTLRGEIALLAQNETGYRNLLALSSEAWLNSALDGRPGIRLDALDAPASPTEGLICLSGGRAGPIAQSAAAGQEEKVRSFLAALHSCFPDRLYVEVQRMSEDEDRIAESVIIAAADALDLPLIATHDCRFSAPEDHHVCQIAACIGASARLSDPDKPTIHPESYLKTAEDMLRLFADLPEACAATVDVARRCSFRPVGRAPILPRYRPNEVEEAAELAKQAQSGLDVRLTDHDLHAPENDYRKRLDDELAIITKMGFAGYFLIVADFVRWARSEHIPVGPGRGSGAGSMAAWALRITDLDPLRFGLLFERFLNPERVSMPDFDIDFCHERRNQVIDYAQKKYGVDRIAHIVTFGTLQARAVLRDVGRVLDLPYMQVDRLAKLIPFNPANPTTLAEALESRPELDEARNNDRAVGQMIESALRLEGLYRNISTHAAGIVIADRPIRDIAPLCKDQKSQLPATQFSMKWAEFAGLVKFDFLGLKTLTAIDTTLSFLAQAGVCPGTGMTDLEDPEPYRLVSSGHSLGVFQMESPGMRDTLRKMKPDCIEDIIALISLYRPGPMKNIDTFIARKQGRLKPDFLHPDLAPLLKETHGVIVYQEQVMEIARILAGYSRGEADLLRRAMGKKKPAEMALQKSRFLSGAAQKGVSSAKAEHIFDLVAEFAGYGFNKSHAAAYAVISYRTAYLKAYHPAEFLTALMSVEKHNTDKLAALFHEARRIGITVRPPDVTCSSADFSVVDGEIVYALGAIKGAGMHAVAGIEKARAEKAFTDLPDLAQRVPARLANRKVFEALAMAGACDRLEPNRARAFAAASALSALAVSAEDRRVSGQNALFGGTEQDIVVLPDADPWNNDELLHKEATAIGFYLSGHPLDSVFGAGHQRGEFVAASALEDVLARGGRGRFIMAGLLHSCTRTASSGGRAAWLRLSDPSGEYGVAVPAEIFERTKDMLQTSARLRCTMRVGSNGRLYLDAVALLPTSPKDASPKATLATAKHSTNKTGKENSVLIRLSCATSLPDFVKALQPATSGAGRFDLDLDLDDGRAVRIRLKSRYRADAEAINTLLSVAGVAPTVVPGTLSDRG